MSGVNQFLPFAVGGGANVLTPAAYAALTTLLSDGFQSGVAESKKFNTPLRQSSFIAAAVAQLVSNDGADANDDGNLSGFVAKLVSAISNLSAKPGFIGEFAGTSAPAGWLACPTSPTNISRTTYAALYAALGGASSPWGQGDGSTTFGMPYFPADYASVQASGNVGTNTTGAVKAHTHSFAGNGVWIDASGSYITNSGGSTINMTQSAATNSTGGTANLPAGVRMLKCVKY